MAVKVIGIGRLQAKFNKLDPITRAAATRGVYLAALQVENTAKNTVPVVTGALRDSIHVSQDIASQGMSASIGTNLEYAPYVELGTSKMRAKPYLQPSLQKEKKRATNLVLNEIRKAYKGI